MKKHKQTWLWVHLGHMLLWGLLYLIFMSPLYRHDMYATWRLICGPFILLYGLLGWIPLRKKNLHGAALRNVPYFLILALLFRRGFWRKNRPRFGTYWKHKRVLQRWALIVLKCYFLPLFTGSLYNAFQNFGRLSGYFSSLISLPPALLFPLVIALLRSLVFISDACVATAGYSIEAKRFKAPILAVETSLMGWMFCLLCYPPANIGFGKIFGLQVNPQQVLFTADSIAGRICSTGALIFLLIYAWGVLTQGLRFANLTYRGTISKGPYRCVRHPQYSAKLISWIFEWLPHFTNPINILFFLIWAGLYVGRTVTEERFLLQFNAYKTYCQKVKWRFIPKIW